MICDVCGGTMSGDGHTIVYHCENVDIDLWWDKVPDDNPISCLLSNTDEL